MGMDIGDSMQNALDTLVGFLPNLIGFVVILIIGYIVAKVLQALAAKLLGKMGIDRTLGQSEAGRFVDRVLPGASPSRGIARLLFWFVFAFFIVAAIGALRLDALNDFMNSVLNYLPNVIVAVLIFVVAAAVAGLAGSAASRGLGDTPTGRIVGAVVPALVMVIATFMILDQLQIAGHIVSIAFAATMFAVALGLALAFGLGGRDVARQMLEEAYAKGRAERDSSRSAVRSHAFAGGSPETRESTSPEHRAVPGGTSEEGTGSSRTGTRGVTSSASRIGRVPDPSRQDSGL
jgi:hypothetical protein